MLSTGAAAGCLGGLRTAPLALPWGPLGGKGLLLDSRTAIGGLAPAYLGGIPGYLC